MAQYQAGDGELVDAFRWSGDADQLEDPDWAIEAIRDGRISFANVETPEVTMIVRSSEIPGGWQLERGDMLIRRADGSIEGAEASDFLERYRPVDPVPA